MAPARPYSPNAASRLWGGVVELPELGVNIPTYLIMLGIMSSPLAASVYFSLTGDKGWWLESLAFLLICCIVALAVGSLVRNKWMRAVLVVIPLLLVFLFELLRLVSFYFQGESFNTRFFFHFSLDTLVDAGAGYPGLIFAVLSVLLLYLFAMHFALARIRTQGRYLYLSLAMLPLLPLLDSPIKQFWAHVASTRQASTRFVNIRAETLNKLGLNNKALYVGDISATPGRNLLLIYLEGLERVYLEKGHFKGLTPNIDAWLEQAYVYTGLAQTPGTEWTIAGMVASQCGTPLLHGDSLIDGNEIMKIGFLSKASCLGDVLDSAGYEQVYLGGASKKFAGKGDFLESHGYGSVNGYDELQGQLQDPGERSGWGIYDDSLFRIAGGRFRHLAESGRPFNLTLLTLDTHHPDGFPSPSCMPYSHADNSMLDAVYCTDQLLGSFLTEISTHPAYADTLVVLVSDHLAMRNQAQDYYPPDYDRKLLFAFLNLDKRGENSQHGTHMDMAPSILSALGVEHDAQFLAGRNLFHTPAPTLAVDFFSIDTMRAVQAVNATLFSRSKQKNALCDMPALLAQEQTGVLHIGNESETLSHAGMAVEEQRFEKDLAMLSVVDAQGNVLRNVVVLLRDLASRLYLERHNNLLLIAPRQGMSDLLGRESVVGDGRLAVAFRQSVGTIVALGSFDRMSDIRVDPGNCEDLLLDGASTPAGCIENQDYFAMYDPSSRQLKVPRLIWSGGVLETTFVHDSRGIFTMQSHAAAPPLGGQDWKYCHVSFDGEKLHIPVLVSGDLHRSVEMGLVSRDPLTVRMEEGTDL